MVLEAHPSVDTVMIVLPCLDQLRTIVEQRRHRTLRGPHNRYVPRGTLVGTLKNSENKIAFVRRLLRLAHSAQCAPAGLTAIVASEPVVLGIGQQDLAMLRRAK